MIKRTVLITSSLSFFLSLTFAVSGQQIKHLDIDNGFGISAVRNIEKDTLGYVWVGSSHGLHRYSGYELKSYSEYIDTEIADIVNHQGNLFVLGTKGILLQYQYEQDNFKELLNFKKQHFLAYIWTLDPWPFHKTI